MVYIISKDDLSIKAVVQTSSDEKQHNTSLTGKSVFTVISYPKAVGGDYIIEKDTVITYMGVIDNVETIKENAIYKINTNQIDSIFDRKIIIANENLISTVGIEDFIKQTIVDNFSNSSDTMLNFTYINTTVLSHTVINTSVETEDGIFNFLEFLGYAKEIYNICLDYEIVNSKLNITISKKVLPYLEVDTTVTDILTYNETYSVDAIAKITVLATNTGNIFNYFLLTDKTISTDINNPNRAKGTIDVVTCSEDAEATQTAIDAFKANSYNHNIVMTITKNSKLYNFNDFIVGRPLRIKTKNNGIYETFISGVSSQSSSSIYTVTCGNMKITLLEKLKGVI